MGRFKPMNFTNEDLSRLRNELDHTDHYPKLKALLNRLEAAERALWSRTYSDSVMEQEADYKAWCKSAGK